MCQCFTWSGIITVIYNEKNTELKYWITDVGIPFSLTFTDARASLNRNWLPCATRGQHKHDMNSVWSAHCSTLWWRAMNMSSCIFTLLQEPDLSLSGFCLQPPEGFKSNISLSVTVFFFYLNSGRNDWVGGCLLLRRLCTQCSSFLTHKWCTCEKQLRQFNALPV